MEEEEGYAREMQRYQKSISLAGPLKLIAFSFLLGTQATHLPDSCFDLVSH